MEQNYTFLSMVRKHVSSSVLLIIATIAAIIVANLPATADWYHDIWLEDVSLSIGSIRLFSHHGEAMNV